MNDKNKRRAIEQRLKDLEKLSDNFVGAPKKIGRNDPCVCGNGKKLNKTELKKYWSKLNLDPKKKKYLSLILWPSKQS